MKLHTILGANGAIATALIPVLQSHDAQIRIVSRTPGNVEGTVSLAADVLNYEQVLVAVQGSAFVYLLVGITYNAKIWKKEWPVIMRNVVEACKVVGSKLIFFDNAYMYGRVKGIMTEETYYFPSSRKGRVRADVANMLLKEMAAGSIRAAIARSVDFYGPGVTYKSAAGVLVFENMKMGRTAKWFINAEVPRSYVYTPDAAEALYLLAISEKSVGEVWHLPSVSPALTGKQFIRLAGKYMNCSNRVIVLPKWFLKVIGLFNPFMRQAYEMNYQDEFAFQFSSAKFEQAFKFTPTPYEDAVKATAEWYLKS